MAGTNETSTNIWMLSGRVLGVKKKDGKRWWIGFPGAESWISGGTDSSYSNQIRLIGRATRLRR